MSERKVLNKYYPPDFDPSKIPRMKLARNRQYTVRLMAPFNMRCETCGEYIYKGKKFNARKEDVQGEDYLGIRIYRFYIKCTRCLQEISFKTDPKNTDYEIEAGATRNFMALKLAEEQAQREEDEEKEEEATNPMKLLEKRTLQSKHELEVLESLEELKDINRRQQTVNYDEMLAQFDTKSSKVELAEKEQEEMDEEYIQSVFGKKRLHEDIKNVEEEDVDIMEPLKKQIITTQHKYNVKDFKEKVAKNLEKGRARLGIRLKAVPKSNDKEKEKHDDDTESASTSVKTKQHKYSDSMSTKSESDTESASTSPSTSKSMKIDTDKISENSKNSASVNVNSNKITGLSLVSTYSSDEDTDRSK